MTFTSHTYTLPAHWAVAVLYGDVTGFDEAEEAAFNAWFADVTEEHGQTFVGTICDEPLFLTYHDARPYGVLACDCYEYTLLTEDCFAGEEDAA